MNEQLQIFLEKLLSETHEKPLLEGLKQDMMTDLYGRLLHHLMLTYIQALPDEHAQAYEHLMQQDPAQEEVQTFFEQHIPNIHDVSAASLLEFRDIYQNAGK